MTVLFMRDNDLGSPFPDINEIVAVATKIAEFSPIVAPAPIVKGPTPLPISLSISLTVEPGYDSITVRGGIYQSIRDILLTRVAPRAMDGVLPRSWITEAISQTPGEYDSDLLVPAVDIPVAALQLPILLDGAITWI